MSESTNQPDPFVHTLQFRCGELLPPAGAVVVAVSGGLDSVALLAGLVAAGLKNPLVVAHLDHGLRAESGQDAEFVQQLAEEHSLPFVCERQDVGALADSLGEGVEQAARTARYEFLVRVARQHGAVAVAVAHHADDQAETILFRALRGTALRGLAGMRARRVLEPPVELVRPMLTIGRAEIEQYASRAGLAWREDASNSETVYRRNFIRHELLPAAREKINPKAEEALCRLGQLAAEAEEALHSLATELLKKARRPSQDGQLVLDARALRSAPGYLRRAVLHRALQSVGLPQRDVTTQHLEQLAALLATADGQMNLPGNGSAQMQKKRLVLAVSN